jgi:acyl-CoA thioesterase-1
MNRGGIARAPRGLIALVLSLCWASVLAAGTPAVRTIVFFGDSLTAGYGLADPDAQSFPALIQGRIDAERLPWRAVNAGLSGETSAGGLRRVDWVLNQRVDVFVLELGANDGLRGISPAVTEANLQGIIDRVRSRNPAAEIILAGMRMPESMGPDFAGAFHAVFPSVAARNKIMLIPFLLEGVAGHPELNQGDSIHPTATGETIVADTVWKQILPLLTRKS